MLFRQKIFALSICLFLVLLIFELVRRRKLREEYSWLWILTAVIIVLLALEYDALVFMSKVIGAVLPTTALFILAILFLMAISLHFCVKLSALTEKVIKLTQELALLKLDIPRTKD